MSNQANPHQQSPAPAQPSQPSTPSSEAAPGTPEKKDFEREGQWAGRNNDGSTSPAKK